MPMSNVAYLIAAYAVVGVSLSLYVFTLRRQRSALTAARDPESE